MMGVVCVGIIVGDGRGQVERTGGGLVQYVCVLTECAMHCASWYVRAPVMVCVRWLCVVVCARPCHGMCAMVVRHGMCSRLSCVLRRDSA